MNRLSETWFPVFTMLAAQICAALAVITIAVLVPLAAQDFALPATWIGGFTSVVYFVAAITGAMTGDLIRRFGAIRTTQIAMVSSAAGLLCFATAQPVMGLLAAVFLGASYGQLNPTSSDVLVRCTPINIRPFVFSIKQTGVVLGGVLAGALAPVLAGWLGWWGAALCVAGVVMAVCLLLTPMRQRFDLDDHRVGTGHGQRRGLEKILSPVRTVLRNPKLRWLAVSSLGFAGIQVCLATFLVIYMTEYRQMGLELAGGLYAINQLAGVIGRLFWGYCAGRWLSVRNTLLLVALISAVGLVAIAISVRETSTLTFALIALVLGFSSFGWNGIMLSELTARVELDAVGDATGGVQFVFFGGVVLIPPLFGLLISVFDYPLAFLSLSCLGVITAAITWWSFERNNC